MEKSNTIVNGIKLQDGRIIQGYPIQQDAVMEGAKETPVLDKTGGYFSIKKKTAKPKPTDEEERYLQKLFTDNAFLILANRERILSDSRMLLTPVTVRNGLAYSGTFQTATLGVYIEWWMCAPYSVLFDEKDDTMALIWYLSGSPLSGGNLCSMVTEDGKTETVKVPFFKKLWPKFTDILADYHDAKELYQAYTLPEVIDILKRETTKEFYTESIKEFRYQAKVNLLNAQLRDWEENYESLKEKCDKYEKEWHFALFQLKKDEIVAFHKEYSIRKENFQNRKEELAKENQELKRKLHQKELTNKEYQPLLSANKKEIEQLKWELDEYANESISTLIPKLAKGSIGLSFGDLDRILSEIAEFVKFSSL